MRITHISLEHIKSYRKATIMLGAGTTAIRGHNGEGKSTMIEAIGFALFDSLPYHRSQFVREGEKSGRVIVGFLSTLDGRAYEVDRRCVASGGGAWSILDRELRLQVATGKDDVLAFLRVHLGLDTTLPLDELYESAIAVQQGTFTADFLQPATARRKKFDALLQVEDYRKAFEQLRDTERYLHDQLADLAAAAARLEAQTADLPAWRQERERLRDQRAQFGEQLVTLTTARAETERQREKLMEAQALLTQREQARERVYGLWQMAVQQASAAKALKERAEAARAVCEQTRPAAERHRAATMALQSAQADARVAADLRVRLSRAEQASASSASAIQAAQARLGEAEDAARQAADLAPQVIEQTRLEAAAQQSEEARRQQVKLDRDRTQVAKDLQQATTELAEAQRKIVELEAQEPVARLLPARQQHLDALKAAEARQQEQRQQATTLAAQRQRLEQRLHEAQTNAEAASERLATTQGLVTEAATLPTVMERAATLDQTIANLNAAKTQAETSLHASQGGMCPLLQERCLNIERRGAGNLEDFFGEQVAELVDKIYPLEEQRRDLASQVRHLTVLQGQVKQLPDLEQAARSAVGLVTGQRDELATMDRQIAAVEAALAEGGDLAARLAMARAEHEASFVADRHCAGLTALRSGAINTEERVAQLTARGRAIDTEIAEVSSVAARLTAIQDALRDLADPRKRALALQAIAQTATTITAEITRLGQQQAEANRERDQYSADLALYADLDQRIAKLQTAVATTQTDYDQFLRHEQEAERVPAATKAAEASQAEADAAEARYQAAMAEVATAAARCDADALTRAQQRLTELDAELGSITERLAQTRQRDEVLEGMIREGEARASELDVIHGRQADATATSTLLAYGRDTIKEAGPYVTRALLRQISGEAHRIFGEIIGDRSALLTWTEEYEITLTQGGYTRAFAQLSGGEQMSAALAVRLALLRTLTGCTLAIFDEPTQNMDGERRANLAEQIRRIRGFEQLLVISHDDTFEEGLDAVIAVRKEGGESVIENAAILPIFDQPSFALPAL